MASDLATLPFLCERTLLDHIARRYAAGDIYTYVADILVALNPYKDLDIYNEIVSAEYNGISGLGSQDPHIFALADTAYQNLKRSGKRQCFLISGESGAGKTESTKLVIQHILRVSRHKRGWLQDTITQISPILEAFGNAKTIMNHNSSRFGKYLQLYTQPDGVVCGINVSQYMLERSRLIKRSPGDNNFHVFYYVFNGLNKQQLLKNFLVSSQNHRYLVEESGTMEEYLKSEHPRIKFEELVLALGDVGFSGENISTMWRILAALLHIGDIKFLYDEETETCTVRTPTVLITVCALLNVEEAQLTASLTSIVSITRGESIRKMFNLRRCEATRDGLAKALYGRLFDWIVDKINILSNEITPTRSPLSIDILDIFGFENFGDNSFEQLCINIANEQLQYFFNQHIFTWEQAEYKKEGIQTELVTFQNNEHILDLLLTRPTGMLHLLDEESRLARGTDASLLHKIQTSWGKHTSLEIPPRGGVFCITHYAGKVSYQVAGILEKNRETLSSDVVKCIAASRDALITEIFCGVMTNTGTLRHSNVSARTFKKGTLRRNSINMTLSRPGKGPLNRPAKGSKGTLNRPAKGSKGTLNRPPKVSKGTLNRPSKGTLHMPPPKPTRARPSQKKKKDPTSVAIFFRNSLKELMMKILEGEPHFIRCIKPNTQRAPMMIDLAVVGQQLKYTGVLETTKIRQHGFSNRLTFGDFLTKYGMLAKPDSTLHTDLDRVKHMMCSIGRADGWSIGHTKIFLKYWVVSHLDKLYDGYIADIVTVQRVVRGFIHRQRYYKMREAEETRRLEEERRQEEILAALQAEQRLKEHLESIRTLTEKCERAGTLALRTINLSDLTSAIFQSDTDDENPLVTPESTIQRSKAATDEDRTKTWSKVMPDDDTDSPIDNTNVVISPHDQHQLSPPLKLENIEVVIAEDELEHSASDATDDQGTLEDVTSLDSTFPKVAVPSAPDLNELSRDSTLYSLDRTLELELVKLARWSMDCEFNNISTFGIPTTLNIEGDSKHSTIDTTSTTTATPTGDHQRDKTTDQGVSYVSTYSLNTLQKDEDSPEGGTVLLHEIKSGRCCSDENSLKITQSLSIGELHPTPEYINTRTLSPGELGPPDLPGELGPPDLPGELGPPDLPQPDIPLTTAAESEQQDSGIEMGPRYDSLDSRGRRRSSGSSFDVLRTPESGTGSIDSRGIRHNPVSSTPLKKEVMSAGGIQKAGSMQSFDEISSSSPLPSSEYSPSPDRASSCVSVSSIPDLPPAPSGRSMSVSSMSDGPPGGIRTRSAASNMSDTVLTTIDRPRTKSFAGTPVKQAWLQVCCYEKDVQTGNFLIDKSKVQIDGQMLHPDAVNDPDLYRISLTGLANIERHPKTERMLPDIGDGVMLCRDKITGDVTLTKMSRKDAFMMNDSFLEIKHDEKCKGKHVKMEQNTSYTIFDKQKFVDDVRNNTMDLTKIHTIGQVAIAFLKINGNSVKGVPCWVKVQCLEAMNLLKNILAGSTPEQLEWLRKASPEPEQEPPRRQSMARLSFGSKSSSKSSLKDSKSSVNSDVPIPRSKSKSQILRHSKKASRSNGVSPEQSKSNRNSGISQHLEPFEHNYNSIYDMIEDQFGPDELPMAQLSPRSDIFRSRRLSSPPDTYIRKNYTTADVSLPLGRSSPVPIPESET